MTRKIICPRCKGNGYIRVIKEVQWPAKEEVIVVQCPMCDSEGEIYVHEPQTHSISDDVSSSTDTNIKLH